MVEKLTWSMVELKLVQSVSKTKDCSAENLHSCYRVIALKYAPLDLKLAEQSLISQY